MVQVYLVGVLVTNPEPVMIDSRRVAPHLQQWASSVGAPCTVCEIETDAVWEGDLSGSDVVHTTWQVIAYGDAANVLDGLQSDTQVMVGGRIWDWQTGEVLVGGERVLTVHVTEAKAAPGRQERVKVTLAREERGMDNPSDRAGTHPPDDYEFFYDSRL